MTREHWIKEFRQELNRLYTPARRLNALIQLYTPNACPNKDIIATLNAIANETADEGDDIIDISLLNSLYNLLALIPRQRPQNDDMKERSQLAEIQRSALNSILWQVFNLKDISEMDDTETRKALKAVADKCQQYKVLLEPIHKIIKPIPHELAYAYRPVFSILNEHPWNQKSRELLKPDKPYYLDDENLHVLSLIHFGISSSEPEMIESREMINAEWWECGIQKIKNKLDEFRLNYTPIQIMFYITTPPSETYTDNDLPELMEAKDAVDGATVLLDHLLSLMEYNKEI